MSRAVPFQRGVRALSLTTVFSVLSILTATGPCRAQSAGFYPAAIGTNGVLHVDAKETYYDGSDGTLYAAVPLPSGATKLQFRVVGAVITDSSSQLVSPDGLFASDGRAHYNNTGTKYAGTCNGTPIGATTGIDPALFGVFFKAGATGAPPDSANYRSDSGLSPDPRTLSSYTPAVNQPFFIGDGYNANSSAVTFDDGYVPSGAPQTYTVPAGATHLLLGLGADAAMNDNADAPGQPYAFSVHVYDDVPSNAPVRLAFATSTAGGAAGTPFGIQPIVKALDGAGDVATSFNGPVTLGILPGTGAPGAALGGTVTVNAVNGVASFGGLSIDTGGFNYVLHASATLPGADSAPFQVTGSGYYPVIGPGGVLTVEAHQTYYDSSDGTLFDAVPLTSGASHLRFRVTGGVITDSSGALFSPDGIRGDGASPYNFTNTKFAGTYKGTPVGPTTGSDPALFAVFFNPAFSGTPAASDNYRADSGLTPDPRTRLSYAPSVNQPVMVGNGVAVNDPFVSNADAYSPAGPAQTFTVPAGATQLLLGIGADPGLNDNGPTGGSFYRAHIFGDIPPSSARRLAMASQFGDGQPGQPLPGQVSVAMYDGNGNAVPSFMGPVILSIEPGTGTAGAILSGTTAVNAVNGVATFSGVSIDKAGLGYVLTATAAAAAPAETAPINVEGVAHGGAFYPTTIGNNGEIDVNSRDTYYDASNGTLFQAVPLPPGATKLQFLATGGIITDPTSDYFGPDGLPASGVVRYNWTGTKYGGTYKGVNVGASTGVDPGLFGVFFNPSFTGTPQDSLNYRSDSGITPDPRTLSTYMPSENQPFWIGDGRDVNNPFTYLNDTFVPAGNPQTYVIPAGATQLLLGIGSDIDLSDNGQGGPTAFRVYVYSDVPPSGVAHDVDGNGVFNTADALLALRIAGGLAPADAGNVSRAGVTGGLTLKGASQLLRLLHGL